MEAPAAPPSLWEVFAALPDPRDPRGRRRPLPALLSLTAVALLAGMRGPEPIAQFARDHGPAFRLALGFTRPGPPCKATLPNLLRALDVEAHENALAAWLAARCPDLGEAPAIDGKALRGSAGYEAPGVRLLAAYAPKVAGVVGRARADGKANEHKAALELLGVLPLSGKVVTGDAMSRQKDVCDKALEGGGDYLRAVKDNQPQLHFGIAAPFAEPAAFSPLPAAPLGA
jgi:DDE_Tnp_1-associated